MSKSATYGLASDEIVSESFDGDIVVLDLASGKYFSFSDSGCTIWEALIAGLPVAAIRAGNPSFGDMGFDGFLATLLEHALLAPVDAGPEPSRAAELLARLGVATGRPEIFVFDDLADLFKADPIHDVAEPAGWPVRKSV